MKIYDFQNHKVNCRKIAMVTCYDAPSADIVEKSNIDCVLVGDSVAMVVHGHDTTTTATMSMMTMHTQAVARKIKSKFIISDLPFLSYQGAFDSTLSNVKQLIQAGAHAVKLEGASGNLETIKKLTDAGVPVMGHLGLTPQSIHQLGGNKVQGKTPELAGQIMQQAMALQQAGIFALVLECIPYALAQDITLSLDIPTIGIGAGPHTDGQILVFHDLLGLQIEFKPKFLKQYFNGHQAMLTGLNRYAEEVNQQQYPTIKEHSYIA